MSAPLTAEREAYVRDYIAEELSGGHVPPKSSPTAMLRDLLAALDHARAENARLRTRLDDIDAAEQMRPSRHLPAPGGGDSD